MKKNDVKLCLDPPSLGVKSSACQELYVSSILMTFVAAN